MRKSILAVAFVLSLLCGGALGATPKVIVNTNTFTDTYFKPFGSDKQVGGGYSASSNAEGDSRVGLDFKTTAGFQLTDNQFVSINTGVQASASGATSFGIATGMNQWLPTANGYRGKWFDIHFYTFVPQPSIINGLASGHLNKDKGDASISNTVTIGGKTYTIGTSALLSGDKVQQTNIDGDAPSTSGFGQDTGYDSGNSVTENGMCFAGGINSDATTIIE